MGWASVGCAGDSQGEEGRGRREAGAVLHLQSCSRQITSLNTTDVIKSNSLAQA